MKALLINGSPHAHGCTYTALGVVADELNKADVATEIVHVGHKDIRGCIGCYTCRELGRCVFDKDMVNEVAKKFEEADGLIISSPVYYAGPNETLVSLLNRRFAASEHSRTSFDIRIVYGRTLITLVGSKMMHANLPDSIGCARRLR